MKIYSETNLKDFKPWAGAKDTLEALTENEINTLENMISDLMADDGPEDGWSETELNDFLWFETDTIAEWLGYKNWEDLLKHREKDD